MHLRMSGCVFLLFYTSNIWGNWGLEPVRLNVMMCANEPDLATNKVLSLYGGSISLCAKHKNRSA